MAKQTTEKAISKGMCYFCRGEFAKNKMTQHLKNCKVRSAQVVEQEKPSQQLFHLFVEGTHRPGYWMHLELPARATLTNLDDFLRAIWVECCGHLSEFTIEGVAYSTSQESEWDGLSLVEDEDDEDDDEGEEDGEQEEEEGQPPSMEDMARQIAQDLATELKADLKDVPLEKIEEKLVQMFAENLPPGMSTSTLTAVRPFLGYMAQALQQGTLAQELEEFEETEDDEKGADVELSEVLAVGKKFSYVYDFGSSTELTFRVIAEREGVIPALPDELTEGEKEEEDEDESDDEDSIELIIMARNEPPELVCHLCGQPATSVASSVSEYESLEETALCKDCAEKSEDIEGLLPLVNSPRVGVCGYSGYDEFEEDEEEEEEEE